MSKLIVFPDANIFIHCNFFDQIDWTKVLNAEDVELVVPLTVFEEIDELKHDGGRTKRIRETARSVSKRLTDHALKGEEKIREDVSLRVYQQRPRINFDELGLDKDSGDDRLIASVIDFMASEGVDAESVLIATNDGPLRVRTIAYGVRSIEIDALRKDEPDKHERRAIKAEQELADLKSKIPNVELKIMPSSAKLQLSAAPQAEIDKQICAKMDEIRKRYPKTVYAEAPTPMAQAYRQIFGHDAESVERNNNALDGFYKKWEQHFAIAYNMEARLLIVSLELANIGNVPAEDIDITITFPKEISVFDEATIKAAKKPPELPKQEDYFRIPMVNIPTTIMPIGSNVSEIRIKQNQIVTFHVGKVKHHKTEACGVIGIFFPSYDDASELKVTYVANIGNRQGIPPKGTLHIKFEKK